MNNRCYRVIFSKAKGMLVVVSEATRSQGKSSNASVGGSDNNISKVGSQTSYYGKYAAISASILISLGLAMPTQTVAETKIVADNSAPSSQQATVLNTASGKVQVNIQTPSAAGVSRNTFSQFDVDKDGAILNNSRTNTQTKLAGWVEGNPWLATGSANVILNEVNSSNPSILNGYTEIAGQKADLVIANPAGIQVQGGGFINSNRTTLTTGNPNLNNEGGLTGFNIDKGNIKIDGDLDDRGSNYTQIISKTAQINSGIYSQNLDVITGENQVSYTEDPTNTQVTSTNTNKQTGVAIDVSNLGGMYANRIRLIGTQKGMGVTNAGNVNAADTLKLDVDGNLVNSGTLGATNDTSIDVSNNQVNNSGTISSSKKTISIESDSLTNSGVINSYDKTTLDQNTAINNSGLISAGALDVDAKTLDNTGRIEQTGTGKLSLETDTLSNTEQAVIGQSLYEDQPKATTPTLDKAPTSATGGNIIVSGKPIDLTGAGNNTTDPQTPTPAPTPIPKPTPEPLPPVTADGSIKVDTLNNKGSNAIITANGVIDGKANQTTNTGKSSIAINSLVTDNSQTDNKVINTDSRMQLNEKIDWDLQTFSNESGQITTKSTANITTDSDINNTKGKLISQGDMTLTAADDLNNTSGVIQGNNTALKTNNLDNTEGSINAKGKLDLTSNGKLTNQKGSISSADDLSVKSTNLSNTGQIYSGGNADIDATENLTNSGLIGAKGNNSIDANTINNTGDFVAGMNPDGSLVKEKANLTVTGKDSLTSSGNHIATGAIELTANKTDLAGSKTQAGTINLVAESGISTAGANMTATDTLTLQTKGKINNQGGNLTAADLNLTANSLDNTKGSIRQTGTEDLELKLANGINNTEGTLQANSDTLSIDTSELTNTKGTISHAGKTALKINADKVDNTEGKVLSLAKQTWTVAETVNNTKGAVQAASFEVKAGELNNTDGNLLAVNKDQQTAAANTLTVTKTLNNTNGNINSSTGSLALAAGTLNNAKGNIKASDDLNIKTQQLTNSGTIYSNTNTQITNQNAITNSGSIAAQGNTSVKTGSLTQTDKGRLISGLTPTGELTKTDNNLTVTATGDITNAGLNMATGDVNFSANNLNLAGSTNQADNINLTATKADVNLDKATTTASKKVAVRADTLSNNQGKMQAEAYELNINKLSNREGRIVQTGEDKLTITANNGVDNTQGTIATKSDLAISSKQAVNNSEGTIQAASTDITAGSLNNQQGTIATTKGNLNIDSQNAVNNQSGVLSAAGISINSGGDINNTEGLIAQTDAEQTLKIKTAGTLSNQNTKAQADSQKGILANGRASIEADNVNNQSGVIAAKALQVNSTGTDALDNSKGSMSAATDLTLKANNASLNNQAGRITANNTTIEVKGSIDNNGADSLIQANNDLSIKSDSLNNQNTKQAANSEKTQGIIAGKGATINTGAVNNQSGQILVNNVLDIDATNALNNDEGNIQAGGKVEVTADAYSNKKGSMNSDTLDIKVKQDITHTSDSNLNANNLKLTTQGAFTNEDKLNAQNVNVAANSITNNKDAEIVSRNTTELTAQTTLNNRGLINGSKTYIETKTATNHSHGRVYGDHVAIKAETLNNSPDAGVADNAPVIAARQRLDLGVKTLNNLPNSTRAGKFNADFNGQANIMSNGELHIGGDLDENHQATGNATTVNNTGATIQSVGNMVIKTETLNNKNADFTTKVVSRNNDVVEYDLATNGSSIYSPDEVEVTTGGHNNRIHDLRVLETGETYETYNKYTYTEVIKEEVTQTSDPSRIISGGSIELDLNEFNTNKSQIIAAGRIKATGKKGTVEAESSSVTPVISYENTNQYYNRRGRACRQRILKKCFGAYDVTDTNRVGGYTKPDSRGEAYQLKILNVDIVGVPNTAVVLSNQNQATQTSIDKSNVSSLNSAIKELSNLTNNNKGAEESDLKSIKALVNAPNSLTASQKQALQDILNAKDNGDAIDKSKLDAVINGLNEKVANSEEVRTVINKPTLPNSSLYGINPDSNASFLIETDSSFTNYRKWLSSSYMLDRLSLKPSNIHKRLGDGYYEQQMVRDQIVALTGQYYLGDYTNFDDQYKALMDEGITFANKHNLRPGIALTAEQIANLTTDIVWLEEQEVTLADGTVQTVLAPRVYTRRAADSIDGKGNLIAAKEVELEFSGKLTNRGNVIADENLRIKTGTLTNEDGGVISGNYVAIKTEGDLNNFGSTMKAGSFMGLDIGGDLNNISSTYESEAQDGKGTSKRTGITKVASIYVGDGLAQTVDENGNPLNTLVAKVGGDTNFGAANMDNRGGNTYLDTKGDINYGAIKTGYQINAVEDDNNYYKQGQSQDVGSRVTGVGSIINKATNVTGTATYIESEKGNTILDVVEDTRFKEGRSQTSMESSGTWEEEKWYGSKDHTETRSGLSDKAITSNIIGDNVFVDSERGDVELIGTNVEAKNKAQVTAMNGKVTIESAVERNLQSYDHSTDSFYKETGHQQGFDNESLNRTGIKGGSVYVNGKEVAVNAADLAATKGKLQIGDATFATDENGKLILNENGKPRVLAGNAEKVEFGTIDLKVKDWDNRQQGYKGVAKVAAQVTGVVTGALGVGDGITVSKSSTSGDSDTLTEKTQLSGYQIVAGGKTVTGEATHFVNKQKGGTTYVLGDNVDLDVGTNTRTEQRATQEEVITGDGMRVKKDSLQLWSVTNTDSTTGKSKTTTTHEGAVFDSDNIVVVANDTLDAISTKFNGDTKDGSLLLGADIINIGGVEDTVSTTDITDIEELTVSAEARHVSVDIASAAEKVKEAVSALAAAKNDLADAKERVARGELAPSALKDYQANLAAAGTNLANAQINLGSVAASAPATAPTLGFSASANADRTDTTTTDTVTQGKWNGSEFNVANITVVGDKFSSQGAKFHENSIITLGVNDATFSLGTNTTTTSGSSKTNTLNANASTTGSYGGGAGYESSSYGSTRVTHSNGEMKVAEINGNLDSLTLDGVLAKPTRGDLEIDELTINAIQDTYNSTNDSEGANASISLGGSKPAGSIGGHKGSGYTDSATVGQAAGIIFEGKDHKLTVGDTYNHGGTIAYIDTDADGNQTSGKLNYITDTYEGTDVVDRSISDNSSYGGQLGTGSVGVQASHTGYEKEVINHNTVGEGAIVLDDARTGKDSFANTNRDVLNTRTVVKDMQTAALDVDASMDTRVFTDKGRSQIANEQANLGENSAAAGALLGAGALTVPAAAAGLLDGGNASETGQNKSGIDKAIDNVKQIRNGVTTSMNDDNAELVAAEELIEEGKLTNDIVNQDVVNELTDNFAAGTDAEKADVYLVNDLTEAREENEGVVIGSANESTQKHIYLDNGSLDRSDGVTTANGEKVSIEGANSTIYVINEEIAHINGQGEAAASTMGVLGEASYNLGALVNRGDINDAKENTYTPSTINTINTANTPAEQEAVLADNKQLLEEQQENGDVFENHEISAPLLPKPITDAWETALDLNKTSRAAILALGLGAYDAIFNEESPKTGNDQLDEVLDSAEPTDSGTKGYRYPGSQEELVENLGNIEGAEQVVRPDGGSTTILPDGTKIDTYPSRTSNGNPGWAVTKPGASSSNPKGDTKK